MTDRPVQFGDGPPTGTPADGTVYFDESTINELHGDWWVCKNGEWWRLAGLVLR